MRIFILNSPEEAKRIYGQTISTISAEIHYFEESFPLELLGGRNRPDIILLSLEWLPFQRIVAAEAKRLDIPTLYVMDGIIEWSYIWHNQSYVLPQGTVLQPLISSNITAIGRHPARILASMGLSRKIHVVGLPRLDDFPRKREISADSAQRILVCSARTPAHNLEQDARALEALRDVHSITQELGLECIWRISSSYANELNVQASRENLTDLLRNASALITLPSTVALEGMLARIPTAIIEYRPVPIYVETAWQIRTREHLYPVLNELLYPPAQKMAYQDYCLDEELELGSASNRLAKLIKHIVDRRAPTDCDVRESSRSGALDFTLVHSQLSSFSASPSAALQYELDAHRAYRRILKDRVKSLLDCWHIKYLRKAQNLPGFRKVARLLRSLESS